MSESRIPALQVVRGRTFSLAVTFRSPLDGADPPRPGALLDITGRTYTAHAEVESAPTVAFTFTVTVDTPSSAVTMSLTAAQTAALARGDFVLKMTETAPGGVVTPIFAMVPIVVVDP